MQPFEHALLLGGQIGDDAVQEQGRLIEQRSGDCTPLMTMLLATVRSRIFLLGD